MKAAVYDRNGGPEVLRYEELPDPARGPDQALIEVRHLQAMARGELRAVIDRSFPLAEASAAHAYIESRQSFGRVLLIP